MDKYLFPVLSLNRNITDILTHIQSANIRGEIEKGLNNEIIYFDEGTHISDVAEIYSLLPETDKAQVRISAAYCQYLWLICDATYKLIDYQIIRSQIEQFGLTLDGFINYIHQILSMPIEEIKSRIQDNSQLQNVERYIEYLRRIQNFEENLPTSIINQLVLADTLRDKNKTIDFNLLNTINLNGHYEVLSNSVYCNGIAFILLHEASHYSMGHLDRNYNNGDEEAADFSAYWSLLNDVDEEHKFSAGCGIMSVLFSFLYLNENLEEDGQHPREDKRIFNFYELIKDDNPKYLNLLIKSFELWGCRRNDYPMNLPPTKESINIIKEYINSHFG